MNSPLVSVVMPAYNAAIFLAEAIDSILSQSYTNFEFIILNDGSVDETAAIVKSYPDKRIQFINFEENRGLPFVLNAGLKHAKGKYIVRMDADDIALEGRIEKQVQFMEANPEVGVSGTLAKINGKDLMHPFRSSEALHVGLLLDNVFVHSSTILRDDIVKKYKFKYEGAAEDYRLWIKFSKVSKLALIEDILLYYRMSDTQYSVRCKPDQLKDANQLRRDLFESLLARQINDEEFNIISTMSSNSISFSSLSKFCKEVESKNVEYDKIQLGLILSRLILRNLYRLKITKADIVEILACQFLTWKQRLSILKKYVILKN